MGRFALAFAAIVILTLSAGLTRGQPQAAALGAGAASAAAFQSNTDSLRAELILIKRATPPPTSPRTANEEPPAPALLVYLAKLAVERGCGRFEWWVLDWNEPSINFYKSLGAVPMDEWTVFRVTGEALKNLANQ